MSDRTTKTEREAEQAAFELYRMLYTRAFALGTMEETLAAVRDMAREAVRLLKGGGG